MTPATLYEITSRPVMLADGFTADRNGITGPRCSIGTRGMLLLGVQQHPLGHVFMVGPGEFAVMAPELRAMLETPLARAAEDDAARRVAQALQELADRPLLARLWWVLAGDCGLLEWLAGRVKGVRLRGA
jgi:hypothetical protein